ncbi:MAG TPA: hypothetical protein VEZ72_11080 [Paenibacillus sp.]|nr:hypothetical protein [Paenibacillus sp.]
MKDRFRKSWRIVAGVLIAALVAQLSIYAWGGKSEPEAFAAANEDDRSVAADVSNLTGATIEDVLELKRMGLSWNEVLEALENDPGAASNRGARDERLAEAGLSPETVDSLTGMGFTAEQIAEAKLLADRVSDQLRELATAPAESSADPFEAAAPTVYEDLAEWYRAEAAVRFMLLLAERLGSYELALEEYVLALQLELDLETMVEDEAAYEEAKALAMAGKRPDELVRLQDIELAVLALVQKRGQPTDDTAFPTAEALKERALPEAGTPPSPLPDAPTPSVEDVRPANPTQAILDELEALNPNR